MRLIRTGGLVAAVVAASLACGGTAPSEPAKPDLTGLSGTWCHVNGYCYTYVGDTIIDEGSGDKGKWRQEGENYISQWGSDIPWVAHIDDYTATTLVLTPYDDNERIVYSKR